MFSVNPDDLHRIFRNLDEDNNGLVSVEQLHHLLHQIGVHTPALEDLESFVGRPSLDYLDFLFFYQALTTTTTAVPVGIQDEQGQDDDLVGAFKVFDLNGDGYISSEELQSVLSRLGLWDTRTGQDCRDMIRVYDQNCDGFLDFQEFKNMMMMSVKH